ncbi:MAG: hypothetical protein E7332_08150 [Clostridiales bacterium]|nr:hypothetical protein [Clostridiales bacterium]
MRVRNLLILLLTIVLTAGLAFVVFVGVQQGPYTFRPTYGLVSSVELNGGTAVTLRVEPYIEDLEEDEEKPKADDALVLEAMEMFEKRLDARGFYDITMTREDDDKIRIEMYTDDYEEISDSGDLTQYICEKGIMKFYDVEGNYLIDNAAIEPGTADILKYDDTTYMLYFKLSEEGKKAFEKLKDDYGKEAEFIIEYDDVELATRQYNKCIKDGQFAASLGFTKRETMNVAYQLNTGILNATFHVEQARSAMPTMGESVFIWIMYSALAAIAVTLVLLVIKFKGFGLLADLVYLMFAICLIFALAAVRLKLSPSGVAGMAVGVFAFTAMLFAIMNEFKANAETMSIREAIRAAFRKNNTLLIDLNAVMLIAGVVMAMFEKSPMAEFSSALALSAAVSFVFLYGVLRGMLIVADGAFPKKAKEA